jgi:hypothetical protein
MYKGVSELKRFGGNLEARATQNIYDANRLTVLSHFPARALISLVYAKVAYSYIKTYEAANHSLARNAAGELRVGHGQGSRLSLSPRRSKLVCKVDYKRAL